jgi:hypothetical protein
MRTLSVVSGLAAAIVLASACRQNALPTQNHPQQHKREIDVLVEQTLVQPSIKAEPGFTAELIVPPGDLYDPLDVRPRPGGGGVWINDDGAQEGQNGGRIWSVDEDGHVSTLIETRRLLPILGFDIAPPEFAPYAGQIVMFNQPRVSIQGAFENHVIESIDPTGGRERKTLCRLPNHGTATHRYPFGASPPGVPSVGITARFGPPGSPFANRFFAATLSNNTIYQTTADGVCTPFVTFDTAAPMGIGFLADGSKMLLSVPQPRAGGADGMVRVVAPDGIVDPKPLVVLPQHTVFGMAVAPSTFGMYAGQLFVTATGRGVGDHEGESTGTATRDRAARPALGKVYRFTSDGQPHLVASGFIQPHELTFENGGLWVTDGNTDYLSVGFYLPDGFVVRIKPQ